MFCVFAEYSVWKRFPDLALRSYHSDIISLAILQEMESLELRLKAPGLGSRLSITEFEKINAFIGLRGELDRIVGVEYETS